MKPICETCEIHATCGYVKANRESICKNVRAYYFGYEQAVERAKKAYCATCTAPFKEKCKVQKWCTGYNAFLKHLGITWKSLMDLQ